MDSSCEYYSRFKELKRVIMVPVYFCWVCFTMIFRIYVLFIILSIISFVYVISLFDNIVFNRSLLNAKCFYPSMFYC